MDKEERKEKKRKKKKGEQTREREKNWIERERKGREKQKIEIFPAFRRSNLNVRSKSKVDSRIVGYTWIPKS